MEKCLKCQKDVDVLKDIFVFLSVGQKHEGIKMSKEINGYVCKSCGDLKGIDLKIEKGE